jgi:hypothetical protein
MLFGLIPKSVQFNADRDHLPLTGYRALP